MQFSLASTEDAILEDVRVAVGRLTNAKINIYMFDGAVMTLLISAIRCLVELLAGVAGKWNVLFTVDAFEMRPQMIKIGFLRCPAF